MSIKELIVLTTFSTTLLFSKGATMTLTSSDFKNKENIPIKYTCAGKNIPPALQWNNFPKNTKSFVLIMDDPDAVSIVWDHWIVYNIPSSINNTKEGEITPEGAKMGKSTNDKKSYVGPCPPKGSGIHGYRFSIYALDIAQLKPNSLKKSDIIKAMKGHILDKDELIGNFEKKKKFLFF